jgi:hypothetical protein
LSRAILISRRFSLAIATFLDFFPAVEHPSGIIGSLSAGTRTHMTAVTVDFDRLK